MPWFFTIPEFIKKRACRYLLQHYLGQFLEEKISLDDLTVDLYNGTGSIHDVPLNADVSTMVVKVYKFIIFIPIIFFRPLMKSFKVQVLQLK